MSDFVELEEELLAHDLESTDLSGVFFLREVDLTIATLADLGKNLEVTMPESSPAFAQICALAAEVLRQVCIVLVSGSCRGIWVVLVKCVNALLSVVNIAQQVVVIIEEIYQG